MEPFSLATIERVVTFADDDSEEYTDEEDWSSEFAPVTFREALTALEDGCWDVLDFRADEVIAYPADWHQDMRTGAWDSETLVIRSRRPEWLDRLERAYAARRKGR